MLKIGITGGIGTGKSYVCRLFRLLGIPVYYADIEAKEIADDNPIVKEQIVELLGPMSYDQDGRYNRKFISEKIFANDKLKIALNEIIHPAVARDFDDWCNQILRSQNPPYILKEAALLYESESYKHLDKIIVVDAPLNVRIERIAKRESWSLDQIMARVHSQIPNEQKVRLADFIIINDGIRLVIPQVMKIHQSLIAT